MPRNRWLLVLRNSLRSLIPPVILQVNILVHQLLNILGLAIQQPLQPSALGGVVVKRGSETAVEFFDGGCVFAHEQPVEVG